MNTSEKKRSEPDVLDSNELVLFAPGLKQFDLKQLIEMTGEQQTPQSLEQIYSRGQCHKGKTETLEKTLCQLFGLPVGQLSEIPVGALTHYMVSGNKNAGSWMMRADPVSIQPNRDHLVLMGNTHIELSRQEAQQMVADINDTYQDTGWQIDVVTSKQWVLRQEESENLKTFPPSLVEGKNINKYLPQGDDDKKWHALLNELQMLLHSHPVNQVRQMQGLATINSLWFWGVGMLPAFGETEEHKPFVQCWSNETLSLALSRLCGVPRIDVPQDGAAWLNQAITRGRHLIVWDELNNASVKNDPVEWFRLLVWFNEQWLSPLVQALKDKRIQRLTLMDADGWQCVVTRRSLTRWWNFSMRL